MRRALIILTLGLGGLVAVWGAFVLLDLLARSEERSVRALPTSERLTLETGSGDLTVVPAAGLPRIEVRAVKGLFGAPQVKVSSGADGRVTVDAECPGPLSFSCSTALRVLAPAGTVLVARTGSGEVTVRGLRRGVDVETGSGDVRLVGVGGDVVRAETGSGSISGRGLTASRLVGDTGSGDVALTASRPPDSLEADTGSGDVDLAVPDVGYRIATDTGSGDEQVDVRRDDASPRLLRADTGSGDITLRPAR